MVVVVQLFAEVASDLLESDAGGMSMGAEVDVSVRLIQLLAALSSNNTLSVSLQVRVHLYREGVVNSSTALTQQHTPCV